MNIGLSTEKARRGGILWHHQTPVPAREDSGCPDRDRLMAAFTGHALEPKGDPMRRIVLALVTAAGFVFAGVAPAQAATQTEIWIKCPFTGLSAPSWANLEGARIGVICGVPACPEAEQAQVS
jgi:hypothetical protein